MKTILRTISLFFLLLLFQFAIGQNTYKLNIEKEESIIPVNINPMTNGDCLVAGREYFNAADPQVRLVRVNKKGDVVWSKIFWVPNYYYGYGIVVSPTNDNGFIAAARLDSSEDYGLGIQIFKCDSSGNIQWQEKLVADNATVGGQQIIQTRDQGYYLVHVDFDSDFIYLSKLSKDGKLLWYRVFNPTDYDDGYDIVQLAENAEGGAMLAIEEPSCEYYCTTFRLFNFAKNGRPDSIIYLGEAFVYGSTVNYINQDSTGTIQVLLNGNVFSHSRNVYGYTYATIPPNGAKGKILNIGDNIFSLQQFLKSNKIRPVIQAGYTEEASFAQGALYIDKDWSITIALNAARGERKHYIELKRYDSLGRICPTFSTPVVDTAARYKPYSVNRYPFYLKQNATGIRITSSQLFSKPVNNTTLLCSGASSSMLANKESTFTTKPLNNTYKINIFPNPVKNYLHLVANIDKNEFAEIQIINSNGRIVKEYSSVFIINNNTQLYDVSSLAKGIYMLKIATQTNQQTIKFIKE